MHAQKDTLLQHEEQIRKYNFEKMLLVWKIWVKRNGCFNFFGVDPTKKNDIIGKKICQILNFF